MVSAIINTTNIDSQMLKRLSRMYEAGISIKDISEQMGIDEKTINALLRMLGYRSRE